MLISGRTELLAIVGDPIAQATTPTLINEILTRRAIDAVLVPMQIASADLTRAVDGLGRIGNFRGAVVTMPHKRAMLPLLDRATPAAIAVGACNVVRCGPAGTLLGDMLDGEGMVAAIASAGHEISGSTVFLAGAGGAAAGIAFAVAQHGADRLIIQNRSAQSADRLAESISTAHPGMKVSVHSGAMSERSRVRPDIAINATSLGMREGDQLPFDVIGFGPDTLVADVVNRSQTNLLTAAADQGCRCVDGTAMLAAQVELMVDYILEGDPG
ncbi:shikimate dehydrogenase family protein [Nocardia tengchongensis]|uniref:shikimate dehydrogenase family protein n=1 Tax=Nocardia tengchongensis TaxID=2055889 RepID=UPI0036753933